MGRIRILSDDLANKIAAGEVVERPASVVKELLENALDAGSTEVRVEIEAGGRKLIRIVDNGSGMLRDDALLAFERHATSKLREARDLMAISTLGFRGEALPSIASVSRLTLETRSDEESTGSLVEFGGGRLLRCDEVALPRGTAVTVRDLFYNVPARKKFLRSEQTELAHIAQLVTHYSLAHPDKSFQLRHGPATLLDAAPVGTARERVYQVFGAAVMEHLIELAPREKSIEMPPPWPPQPDVEPEFRHYRLTGFVSQPQLQKTNRNSIYLFVNGRLIRDRLLLHGLTSAYASLMPPAAYPFALLFLDCDPEEVDVNVHPSKTEVRFRHSGTVHDFVRDAIREQLMVSRPATMLPKGPEPVVGTQAAVALPFSEFSQDRVWSAPALGFSDDASRPRPVMPPSFLTPPEGPLPRFDFGSSSISLAESTGWRLPMPDTHGPLPDVEQWDVSPNLSAIGDLRVMGQLHESFIVAAGPDGLWIIDQHVAHERILFEQVLERRTGNAVEVQALLLPLLIDLTPGQLMQFESMAQELRGMGFEIDLFGVRTVAIKAAPAGLDASDIERVLFEVLEMPDRELRSITTDDLRRNLSASIACRAAIKINTPLEPEKMRWLLVELSRTKYPMSCPHGRPIALRYSMKEILRSFHRI